jgi:hypothetical protein
MFNSFINQHNKMNFKKYEYMGLHVQKIFKDYEIGVWKESGWSLVECIESDEDPNEYYDLLIRRKRRPGRCFINTH